MPTVLYPERMYPDDSEERRIFAPGTTVLMRDTDSLAELTDADCAAADGLMIFRHSGSETDFARFPKLRAVVRMGVGYDRIDRAAAARRGVLVCNVPDYGTTEVADHAIALALALARGLIHHHERQRAVGDWTVIRDPAIRRFGAQTFGVLGLGRIGTAVALRAKALGFRVVFYDPYRPNGTELALGIARAATLEALLAQSNILSVHVPLTGRRAACSAPRSSPPCRPAPSSSTPRAARRWISTRWRRRCGPATCPPPGWTSCRSSRRPSRCIRCCAPTATRDPALEGRLIVTPHSAYWTPEAEWDIRIKSAETMAAALGNSPQNVIGPEDE